MKLACTVVVLALFAPLAPPQGLTPHRVATLRAVTDVQIAPDGARIAYVRGVPRTPGEGEDGPSWAELHVIDRKSGASVPFVTGEVNVSNVRWTPDGKALSFLAKRGSDKTKSLYVIPVDGGEARRAAQLKTDVSAYSWSADGKRVALIAAEAEPEAVEKRKKQGFAQEAYEEDWRQVRVWIATAFESEPAPRALPLEGAAFAVEWSPAADRLAVAVGPTPLTDDSYMRQRLRVVDLDGKVVGKIENPGKLGEFSWSPDGKRLAYLSAADINDPHQGRLMVTDVDAPEPRDVLPGFEGDVDPVAWQDANTLMFVTSQGVATTFEKAAADGSGRKTLIPAGSPSPTRLSLSKDGQHAAFVADAPAHPAEAWTMSHGDAGPRKLTDSNPWLANARLAKQEVVKHKARDGLELEGLLVRPLDEEAGKRYPLIVLVHGGPEAHVRNGWLTGYSNPGQMAAARGFAVFYPNYRGSTGRGVAFSKLSQADPAGKEFDDLVDAVDHLVGTGLVDRAKVGVTGGSYGGYATAWCSTKLTDRFAAGVMFVGISDKLSKIGTTDIADEEYYVHARKRVWEDWQFFLERSPIYHAAGGKTPLLILHGKDDPRVNVGQSRELYRHLKLHGKVPVRLILYPGEQHGNRKAAARLDYSLRMLQWMEHYLKGPGGAPPAHEIDTADPDKAKPAPAPAGAAGAAR
jgi:dipeptidyl aminopeptidase/acylaminoacyl peptidase